MQVGFWMCIRYPVFPCQTGRFRTERSQIGELLFQVKYRHDKTKIPPIAEIAAKFVKEEIAVDGGLAHPRPEAIILIPPSTVREFQPVIAMAARIGETLDLPAVLNYLIKEKKLHHLRILQVMRVDRNN